MTKDAAQAFMEYQARKQAEAELAAHKFTIQERDAIARDLAGDNAEARNLAKQIWPHVLESHKRGDYLLPHEMDRKQFREYKGLPLGANVYDLAEIREYQARGEWELVRHDVKTAQAEGRLMLGPGGNTDAVPFAGESKQARAEEMARKINAFKVRAEAISGIAEITRQLKAYESEGLDLDAAISYGVREQKAVIKKLTGSPYAPETLPGWDELKAILAAHTEKYERQIAHGRR